MLSAEQEDRLYRLLGERVRARRTGRLTQVKLAQMVCVARTSLTNLERGKQRLPIHLLMRIADALDCELADLMPSRSELGLAGATHDSFNDVTVVGGPITPSMRAIVARYTRSEEARP